jgi:phosphomannomutase
LIDLFTKYESIVPELLDKSYDYESVQLASWLAESKSQLFDYLLSVFSKLQHKHNFAVDFSSGAGTSLEYQFLQLLQQQWHTIKFFNQTPDGSFPSHLGETIDEHNYCDLKQAIQSDHNINLVYCLMEM